MGKIFTIGEKDNLLIGWKNNHDFGDTNAPQVNEIFLQLFTEPWMAQKYIDDELKREDIYIYEINSNESWDFYGDFALNVMDVKRATINRCDLTRMHDEVSFNLISLGGLKFNELLSNLENINTCKGCYQKDIFIAQNLNKKFKILSNNF